MKNLFVLIVPLALFLLNVDSADAYGGGGGATCYATIETGGNWQVERCKVPKCKTVHLAANFKDEATCP